MSAHRPSPGAQIGAQNREAVRQYFAGHIGCSNVECAQALGLSVMAVGRHIATLRRAWIAACVNHPDRPTRTNLDGDELCQECADAWVRGEGESAAYADAEADL